MKTLSPELLSFALKIGRKRALSYGLEKNELDSYAWEGAAYAAERYTDSAPFSLETSIAVAVRSRCADGARKLRSIPRGHARHGVRQILLQDHEEIHGETAAPATDVVEHIDLSDRLEQVKRQAWILGQRKHRILLELLRGRTLASIANDLRVSEARVCQIKGEIVAILKKQVAA